MQITRVAAHYLRLPEVSDRCDGTQDTCLIQIDTDAGVTGWGEVDSAPTVVKAIVEAVEFELKQAGGPAPVRIEGGESRQWVLLDYGTFVVHVFDDEMREFYALERLWGDRPRVERARLALGLARRQLVNLAHHPVQRVEAVGVTGNRREQRLDGFVRAAFEQTLEDPRRRIALGIADDAGA